METTASSQLHAFNMSVNGDLKVRTEDQIAKRKIKRTYILICVGVVLLFSGYSSMLLLQSSINIVDGLGAKATAVNYGTSIFFGIFIVPIVIRLLGAKKSMIASEIVYIAYVLANAYPKEWLLMIVSVMVGCAAGTFWVPCGLLFTYYGHIYHRHSKKTEDACVREFCGIMFALYQLNMIFGNIFVFVILHFLKSSETPDQHDIDYLSNSTTMMTQLNVTESVVHINPYLHCGANDCQDPEKTQQHIDRYVPSSPMAIYVLILTFVAVMITGCTIHICLMPDVPMNFISGKLQFAADVEMEELERDESADENKARAKKPNKVKQMFRESCTTLKDLFYRSIDFRQILIYPINIYLGLEIGFLYSELTRAFASCIKGVSQIGICTIINALAGGVMCFYGGRLMGRFGMTWMLVFAFISDAAMYTLCAVWVPTEATSWLVYLVFIVLGFTGGCWTLLVPNLYAESFKENRELSYTMWSCNFSIGFALQFAWSTLLCVRDKIYAQLGLLVLTVICVTLLRRKMNRNTTI